MYFLMITNRNESKALLKHIPLDGKYKFNSTTCNSIQKWNNDKCQYECKKYRMCKTDYSWNHSNRICKNGKYLTLFKMEEGVREGKNLPPLPISFSPRTSTNVGNSHKNLLIFSFKSFATFVRHSLYFKIPLF